MAVIEVVATLYLGLKYTAEKSFVVPSPYYTFPPPRNSFSLWHYIGGLMVRGRRVC